MTRHHENCVLLSMCDCVKTHTFDLRGQNVKSFWNCSRNPGSFSDDTTLSTCCMVTSPFLLTRSSILMTWSDWSSIYGNKRRWSRSSLNNLNEKAKMKISFHRGNMIWKILLFWMKQIRSGWRIPKLIVAYYQPKAFLWSDSSSGSTGPGLDLGRGHCVAFMDKILYSHNASIHLGVQTSTCQENVTKWCMVTCRGLILHFERVAISQIASCYRNWNYLHSCI